MKLVAGEARTPETALQGGEFLPRLWSQIMEGKKIIVV